MSEFEDKLNSILSDPGQMEKITQMASKLMGGGQTSETQAEDPEPFLDTELLSKMSRLLKGSGGTDSSKTALLKAMEPYLSKERRSKMEKAMRFAKVAKMAGIAFSEFGGEGDGKSL